MGYKNQAIQGVSWLGAQRIVTRVLSFGRTALLARLLTPSQFGTFGIAIIVLSFMEIVTETGINVFLTQKKETIDKYINTAWVVSILRGSIISIIIFLSAPLISGFFNTPQATNLLMIISLVPLLRGFINPSIVIFVKDLHFKKEFLYRTSVFFVESIFTIVFVLVFESFYGLAYGLVVGSLYEVVLSFIIIKPRPTFQFTKLQFREVVGRGKWLTLAGVFNYLYHNGDDIVVGRLLGTSSLGLYEMAYRISMLPITEISNTISKVTFPIFVKINEDRVRMRHAYYKSITAIALIVIPMGLIFFIFPTQIIKIVLGEQWVEAGSVLQVLAIFGVIQSLAISIVSPLYALDKQEYITVITLVSLVGLGVTIVPFVQTYGLVGAGYSALVGSLLSLPFSIYYLRKVLF